MKKRVLEATGENSWKSPEKNYDIKKRRKTINKIRENEKKKHEKFFVPHKWTIEMSSFSSKQ